MLGQKLAGRYRLIKQLGQGGFGQAYLAEDEHLPDEYQCVVKRFHMGTQQQDDTLRTAKRLFDAEAKALHRLGHHDQLPKLLAHFEDGGEFFLVEEYIAGHSLEEELQAGAPFTETQVMDLLQDLLTILSFVHENNVIHRDIKPSNIIRRAADGRLVLIDFGAVKQVSTQIMSTTSLKPNTVVIGTPGYMPSEQFRGSPRPSSDVYAVGMIAIQGLTGLNPSLGELPEDETTGEICWQDQTSVSVGLAAILNKMVLYDFRERYRNASEALADLQAWRQSQAEEIFPPNAGDSLATDLRDPDSKTPDPLTVAQPTPSIPPTAVFSPAALPEPTVVQQAGPVQGSEATVSASLQSGSEAELSAATQILVGKASEPSKPQSGSFGSRKLRWVLGGGLTIALSGTVLALGSPHLRPLCSTLGNCSASIKARSSYAEALQTLEKISLQIKSAQSIADLRSLKNTMTSALQTIEQVRSRSNQVIAAEDQPQLATYQDQLTVLNQKIDQEVKAENQYRQGIAKATIAFKAKAQAKTLEALEENRNQWQAALKSLESVPKPSFVFTKAQTKMKDYQAHIKNINQQIDGILAEEEARRQRSAVRQSTPEQPAAPLYDPPPSQAAAAPEPYYPEDRSSYQEPPPASPEPAYQEPAPAPANPEPLWGGSNDPQSDPLW
ncbi:protein kinase domain-containing protein [Lyngbya confervoides]|uniref:non-specific serine/threonine protein kinase n=1 Tax=Lyngbya confervoides BDU141951 TaxID=1574623 RepID=A0ABD4SZC6_9CYAN|nr:protein kinase [Lyngbya confervoides]MCM1981417.1 protein kinase [Lyngbya confervoides BDU141951]